MYWISWNHDGIFGISLCLVTSFELFCEFFVTFFYVGKDFFHNITFQFYILLLYSVLILVHINMYL